MKVSVKVPTTTANFGSGFDCMAMALPIYNTITIEETVLPGTGIEINILAENEDSDTLALEHIPTDENNIIYKAKPIMLQKSFLFTNIALKVSTRSPMIKKAE